MTSETSSPARRITFAVFSMLAGVVGWIASFELLTEYIKTLQNPDYVPNCSVSLLVTCGPNMGSWQGSLFGFSNPIIGVTAFAAPVFVGAAVLAGARFRAWFWQLYQLGLLGGFVFVCWLQYQSIFELGTLCPWCMVAWAVMIPLWWITLPWPYASGEAPVSPGVQRFARGISSWIWVIVLLNVLIVAAVAQFQLDWFAEFSRL